jgi:hypothetical protein
MINKPEDNILKAFTGLEGGIVASGSTCGVVSGGAIGLALSHYDEIVEKGIPAQAGLLVLVGEYIKWFKNCFGTSTCRERSGVDFYTTKGQLRYFFPGDKVSKCLRHIYGSTKYLYSLSKKDLPTVQIQINLSGNKPIHCAQKVLNGIKEETGIGDELLEKLSFVFDGGVGYQGGACGALVGAIMGVNLLIGMDVRNMNIYEILKAFAVGHKNLLIDKKVIDPEPFAVGKKVVQNIKKKVGALDCETISGQRFSGWLDFQKYISSSQKCHELIKFAEDQASIAIDSIQQKLLGRKI